jgi:lipopolysaccharide biosynthesis regulator YciM
MKENLVPEEILCVENEEEEIALLKKIVQRDPTNVGVCLRLGNLLRKKGYPKDALKLHKSLLIEDRKLPSKIKKMIYKSIIKDYLETNSLENVIRFAHNLRKLEQEDREMLEFLYEVYVDIGEWREAIELKKRIIKLTNTPDDRTLAILYAFWGNSLAKKNDKKQALRWLNEALKLDKFCVPALIFIGDFYYEENKVDESIKFWEKILYEAPDFAFLAFEKLQNAYYAKHELSKLESLYIRFLNRNPSNVKVLTMLSEIYEKKGEDKEAIETLEKAIEVDTQNVEVIKKLINLYYENKEYDKMLKLTNSMASILDYSLLRCQNCGIKVKEFKFRCPNCKAWLTIR